MVVCVISFVSELLAPNSLNLSPPSHGQSSPVDQTMTSDFDMAEVKGSLQKVEKKIELVEEEMEQVKTALKIKGTYLGSNGRKWQQEQLRQLQEKERLLMEDKRQLQEDKRQLREKELGLLPPQTPAPEPAGISKKLRLCTFSSSVTFVPSHPPTSWRLLLQSDLTTAGSK